jgi:hypothetical protein
MRAQKPLAVIIICALVAGGIAVSRAATEQSPVYKPPLRGAPRGRLGAGTRGGRDMFVLSAWAPDHTGLTVSEQPSLYWFISRVTDLPVEVAISDPRTTQPLLETRLASPVPPGVHRIKLADLGVRLVLGVTYRWSVTVIADPDRRSRDFLAGGLIERVDPPEALQERLAQAPAEEVPFLYAEAGLWYDALTAISELIERTPGDTVLLNRRAALLGQVGLPELSGEEGTKTPRL